MYTNIIGFIIVGMFIGACLLSIFSFWLYKKNCPEYTEIVTGVIWDQKCVASSCVDNKPYYIMESTKDAHVECIDYLTMNKRFKKN